MIKTADTNYAADYDTYYERSIMSRYFARKSQKCDYLTKKISDDHFSLPPQIMTFFSAFYVSVLDLSRKIVFHKLCRLCRLFLPIPDTTDYLIIGTDYAYGRCIGTALVVVVILVLVVVVVGLVEIVVVITHTHAPAHAHINKHSLVRSLSPSVCLSVFVCHYVCLPLPVFLYACMPVCLSVFLSLSLSSPYFCIAYYSILHCIPLLRDVSPPISVSICQSLTISSDGTFF